MTELKKVSITQSELDDLLESQKYSQKVKDRQSLYSRKRNARLVIMYKRALENNVPEPTDDEIKKYMSRKK